MDESSHRQQGLAMHIVVGMFCSKQQPHDVMMQLLSGRWASKVLACFGVSAWLAGLLNAPVLADHDALPDAPPLYVFM
jgi:hypothetical protein